MAMSELQRPVKHMQIYTVFSRENQLFGLSHHQEWVQVSLPCRLSINSSIICRNGFRVRPVSPCGVCSAHRLGSFQKFHLRSPAYRPNTIWLATHSEGSLSLALFPPLFLFSSFHLLWYMCVKCVAVLTFFFPSQTWHPIALSQGLSQFERRQRKQNRTKRTAGSKTSPASKAKATRSLCWCCCHMVTSGKAGFLFTCSMQGHVSLISA